MVAPGVAIMGGLGQIAKRPESLSCKGRGIMHIEDIPFIIFSASRRSKMPRSFILEDASRGFLDEAFLNHKGFLIRMEQRCDSGIKATPEG